MQRDNTGVPIPIGQKSYVDFHRAAEATRNARALALGPHPNSQAPINYTGGHQTHVIVRITGFFDHDAEGQEAVVTFRNLNRASETDPLWIDAGVCIAFDINDNDLEVGRRYQGDVYGYHVWTPQGQEPRLSCYVAVSDRFDNDGSSSSSSSSSGAQGNGIRLVSEVSCDDGGLLVDHARVTGYVMVGGKRYNIVLEETPTE